jgi:hypothetical protein
VGLGGADVGGRTVSTKCKTNKDKERAAALLAQFAALQQH